MHSFARVPDSETFSNRLLDFAVEKLLVSLRDRLLACPTGDRAVLARRLQGVRRRLREGKPIDQVLAQLVAAIDSAESALAADPGPLVAALGEVVHAAYEVVGSVRARQAVFANAPPSRVAVDRLDSALAAYRAALKGGKV